MEHAFWLDRWQKNEIGFHASEVQPALAKHWSCLNVARGARVLVPLCGKSLDMTWLEQRGCHVVGAELSALAVRDFFAEWGVVPDKREHSGFEVSHSGDCEIWCGDFFALRKADVAVEAAYDRAALVAMPPQMQARYAAKMAELIPTGGKVLLIGLDYNPQEMQGPPFNISQTRVEELFGGDFTVSLIEARDGLTTSEHLRKRGVTWLEEASYLLVRA